MDFSIKDDLLAPKGIKVLEFKGPNPFGFYKEIPNIMQLMFEVKGKDTFETDFRWDITSDPRPFFIKTHIQKKFDGFTGIIVALKIQGKQPSDPTKNGDVRIEISGTIETKYPANTVFQKIFLRPFIYLYYYTFYNKVRMQYFAYANRRIERLEDELRASFNLIQRAHRSEIA